MGGLVQGVIVWAVWVVLMGGWGGIGLTRWGAWVSGLGWVVRLRVVWRWVLF